MDILIKKALIYDTDMERHNGERKDILISNGIIKKIAKNISQEGAKVISSPNLHCSVGWMDIGTQLGEPGYEYRETTRSISEASCIGGYTAIVPFPNTQPVIQSASNIKYLQELFSDKVQDVFPIAALSCDLKGVELTEMKDLADHGAVGFGDGLKSIQSAGLLLRALQYNANNKIPVIDHPQNMSLAESGQMHEGDVSITMGLKGIPSISESVQVARNIAIAKYSGATIIFHAISARKSLQLIKQASRKGSEILATVPYLNLVADHHRLEGFNVNFKVLPPLRAANHRNALLTGVRKGDIAAIISNHHPIEVEHKMLEFPYASPGATGLETCFSALCSYCPPDDLVHIVRSLSTGPRRILNLPLPEISIGARANLTFFDPDKEWIFEKSKSLSKNNPFLGEKFKGKVLGVINGKKHFFNT